MQFQQNLFGRLTRLALREHGLYVCQTDAEGRPSMEVEMPYEEMLPVRLERRPFRWQGMPWLMKMLFSTSLLIGVHLLFEGTAPDPESLPWVLGAVAALGALAAHGWRNWWRQVALHTARVHVVLTDRPSDWQALVTFAEALDTRTKQYLREEYGSVNPLGIIEPQLRRVAWLREINVLSVPEATALATRLTGRLSTEPLVSMGQELEPPYVN